MGFELTAVRREEEADGGPRRADAPLGEHRDHVIHRPPGLVQPAIQGVVPPHVVPDAPVQLEVERDDEGARPVRHRHDLQLLTPFLLVPAGARNRRRGLDGRSGCTDGSGRSTDEMW